jgi:predicted dithiol-disulfide oxidoreductase (DUF899 family)
VEFTRLANQSADYVLLCPVWNVLDLTPQGRGDWYAELS